MGRPERRDIDYFPFYIKDGRTLFILEGKYECKGTGFFTNLFRFLSRTPDHHFPLEKESDRLFFFTSTKCDKESALDMIEIMVETGKLDRDLWEQKKILASQDFLDSIQEAYRKRINNCITLNEIKSIYNITSGRKTHINRKLPEENPQKPSKTPKPVVSDAIKPQSKVKEIKEKIYKKDFLIFYEKYPLKKSKTKAFQSWKKLNPDLNICLAAIKAQITEKSFLKSEKKFCPEWKHPSTWLNQQCWEDEIEIKPESIKVYD